MRKNKLPPEALELFRKWGVEGGKAAAQSMTPAQRVKRARRAVAAREAKRKAK